MCKVGRDEFQFSLKKISAFPLNFGSKPTKVKLMAMIGRAITPIMAKMVIMGVMARPIMAKSLTFMGVPGKYGLNVDHL